MIHYNKNTKPETLALLKAIESGDLEQLIDAGANSETIADAYRLSKSTLYTYLPTRLKRKAQRNITSEAPSRLLFKIKLTPARKLALCERWA